MGKDKKINKSIVQIKDYVKAMPKKTLKLVVIIASIVLVFAIVMTLLLNNKEPEHKALFVGASQAESSQVFTRLVTLGADVKMSPEGNIMVPTSEYDVWLYQMVSEGFPKTTLTYDVFSSHSGMTVTETERQQGLVYQLNDRMQATLLRMDGVADAVVTINMAETSDYIWDKTTDQATGSASVLLTMQDEVALAPEQVSAIQNLVAYGVPKMTPEAVTVIDARTMLEYKGEDEEQSTFLTKNLEFEAMVREQIEQNIEELLQPRYGVDGVVAKATVKLNYDKMMTEQFDLVEKEEGGGYPTHSGGEYNIDGSIPIGGIVGEEDNTDIPGYPYGELPNEEDTTRVVWDTDIDYSYVKTQIEKGQAVLERATVSVVVDEENMTQVKNRELVNLVSKAADIDPSEIFVSSFAVPPDDEEIEPTPEEKAGLLDNVPTWALFAAGGALLVIIGLIVLLVILAKRKKKKKKNLEELASEENLRRTKDEIQEYKQQLTDAANTGESAKSEAIVEEIRDFAKDNPEITASLLRSWLKEDE